MCSLECKFTKEYGSMVLAYQMTEFEPSPAKLALKVGDRFRKVSTHLDAAS